MMPVELVDVVVAAAQEDGYEYGAVAAPGWVLPVAALVTIAFGALIPIFLRSGEE